MKKRKSIVAVTLISTIAIMVVGCSNQKSQDTSFIGTSSIQTTETSTSVTKTTTVAPATSVPTTTVAPATSVPTTTVAPTTVAPTTIVPTTVAPTTVAPTTVVPTLTTIIPTTSVPTTTHTHTYSTDWTNDSINHWHECSCGEKESLAQHTYGEWIITKEATHTEAGSKKQVCGVCGYENVEEIPAIGHNYSDNWTNDATNHWHECSCGEKSEVAAHTYGEWIITKEATHTDTGSKKQVCSVCGYGNVEEIPAIGHTYSDNWTNDATNHWHECSCGEKESLAQHTYGEWIITKEATHADIGSKKQVCGVCGYENVEEIPALGHTYSDNWSNDATNHWHECSCGEKESLAQHTHGEWIITKEATHTDTGSKKQVCSVCGYENVEEIPAIGHTYSELWSYNDSNHWHECSCSDKSETASHSFVDGVCSVCGYKEGSQGLEYILSSNKDSYYVKGIGECTDTDIVIPEYYNGLKITNINSSAFKDNTEIKSVFISKNVLEISGEAFENCTSLESVVFEEGVTNIAWYAFINCTSLKNVFLPSSLSVIGSAAFKNCTSLTSINIPDKVTALYGTFEGCNSLQNITLSKNLSLIGSNTFYGCSKLTEIVLPKSITKIESFSLYTYKSIVIYYEGDLENWNKIEISEYSKIDSELIYLYSETQPLEEGNYWHYDIDGLTPLQW